VQKDIEYQQTEDVVKEDAKTRATKDFSMIALQCLELLVGLQPEELLWCAYASRTSF
jgi:hypothetical protein